LNEPTVAYRNKLLLLFCCQLVQALVIPLHNIFALCMQRYVSDNFDSILRNVIY